MKLGFAVLLLAPVTAFAAPATPDYIALPVPLVSEILATLNKPLDNRQLVEIWTRIAQCVQEQTPGPDGALHMQGVCPAATWVAHLQEAAAGKPVSDKPAPPLSVSHPPQPLTDPFKASEPPKTEAP